LIAVVVLGFQAWKGRAQGWGIPMLAVLFTAFAWYPGDGIYNNYEDYVNALGEAPLTNAWWEVLLFFISFAVLVPLINDKMNGALYGRSRLFQMMRNRTVDTYEFQDQVALITRLLLMVWVPLMILALLRTDFNVIGMFFPYLGYRADPWGRSRMGGGIDAIFAFAAYLQIMLTALFGVVFALNKRPKMFLLSCVIYLLSVPFYIFDRTRNTMLAVLIPGFMALVTLRIKGGVIIRLAVVGIAFIALEGWMKLVIENRGSTSMSDVIKGGGTKDESIKSRKHEGFNMFEELGYINYFIANGTYKVNWGERYFAEAVNPIPRVIWPGKPMIGIDYAIARGMSYGNVDASQGGVACSVSTGMIGQGVVNFGRILGPIAAALLMAIWVAVLARQDLMGNDIGHLLLYAIGLVLTFNMGRDITLLVIYPFVFGWLLLHYYQKKKKPSSP
jgi:hypothetical protein